MIPVDFDSPSLIRWDHPDHPPSIGDLLPDVIHESARHLNSQENPQRSPSRVHRLDRWVLIGIPAAVFTIALATVLDDARSEVVVDLQLFAAPRGAAGCPMAVRAVLFVRQEAALADAGATVRVELRSLENELLADSTLHPAALRAGFEGGLEIPPGLSGPHQLLAVHANGAQVRSTVELAVDSPPGLELSPRPSLDRERWRPVRPEPDAAAVVRELVTRPIGGACTPDVACPLITRVRVEGDPDRDSARSLRIEGRPIEGGLPVAVVDGWAEHSVTVRGPEADIELVVESEGRTLARRSGRLPIALAALRFEAEGPREVEVGARPILKLAIPRESETPADPVLIDAFVEGRWVVAASELPGADGRLSLPFSLDRPGDWRIQLRRSLWSMDSASALMFRVTPAPRDSPAANHRLAFDFAEEEFELRELPRPVSGGRQASEVVQAERPKRFWIGAMGIILAGILLALWLARRSLAAAEEANRVMNLAGGLSRRRRWLDRLLILTVCATIALLFVTVGLLLLSRGLL